MKSINQIGKAALGRYYRQFKLPIIFLIELDLKNASVWTKSEWQAWGIEIGIKDICMVDSNNPTPLLKSIPIFLEDSIPSHLIHICENQIEIYRVSQAQEQMIQEAYNQEQKRRSDEWD